MRVPCLIALVLATLLAAGCRHVEPEPSAEVPEGIDYSMLLSGGADDWPTLEQLRLNEPEADRHDRANATARLALEKSLTVDFDSVALDAVVDFIRDTTGANIAVNWPALELVEIDQDSFVTLTLNAVEAGQILQLALDQVSADHYDDDKAGFRIYAGVIVISTRADLRSETSTRVYDVRDLLYLHPVLIESLYADDEAVLHFIELMRQGDEIVDYLKFDLNDALMGSSGGRSSNQDKAETSDDEDTRTPLQIQRDLRVDQLVDLIQDTVGDLREWLDQASTISELNGNLVIKTTPENHEQIRQLLAVCREAQMRQFQRQARLIEVLVLLRRAEGHRLNQEYRDALRCLDQALRVDPENPQALALKEIVEQTMSR